MTATLLWMNVLAQVGGLYLRGEVMENNKKTYKREVAVGLIVILSYQIYASNVEMVNVLVWPILTFAGGAFGIDAIKQLR